MPTEMANRRFLQDQTDETACLQWLADAGEWLLLQRQFDRATALFEALQYLRPTHPLGGTGLCRVALETGHPHQALRLTHDLIQLADASSDDLANVYALRGDAYLALGKPGDARRCWSTAIGLQPLGSLAAGLRLRLDPPAGE